MGHGVIRSLLIGAIAALVSFPAFAADTSAPSGSFISEARLGVYKHTIEPRGREQGVDVSLQVLFQPLPGQYGNVFIDFLLTPRPHVGATISTNNKTSFAYTGLTWTKDIGMFFIEGEFGISAHNGKHGTFPGRAALGCGWAFHEAFSVGLNIANDWRVMGTIEHFSNANLCSRNAGITNAGVRVGRMF